MSNINFLWQKSIVLSHVTFSTSDNAEESAESHSSLSEYSAS